MLPRFLVLCAFATIAAAQSFFPCHPSKSNYNYDVTCSRVELPPQLCQRCPLRPSAPDGRFEDCSRIYDTENDVCHAAIQEYVDLNAHCDPIRSDALPKMLKGNDAAKQVIDYFLYSICEQCCDCIPMGTEKSDYMTLAHSHSASAPALWAEDRGNCPAHSHFDVCKNFPHVTYFAKPGDPAREGLPKGCDMLRDWQRGPESSEWETNPKTNIVPELQDFLRGLLDAVDCADFAIWGKCYDMENKQNHLALPAHQNESEDTAVTKPPTTTTAHGTTSGDATTTATSAASTTTYDEPSTSSTTPTTTDAITSATADATAVTTAPADSSTAATHSTTTSTDLATKTTRPSTTFTDSSSTTIGSPSTATTPGSTTTDTSDIPVDPTTSASTGSTTTTTTDSTTVESFTTTTTTGTAISTTETTSTTSVTDSTSLAGTTMTTATTTTTTDTESTASLSESPTPSASQHETSGEAVGTNIDEEESSSPAGTSSDNTESGSTCFPSSAVVELASGQRKPISQLRIGDSVRVGKNTFSDVFLFSHRTNAMSAPSYVELEMEHSNATLRMTAEHLLRVNGSELVAARMVKRGDRVQSAEYGWVNVADMRVVRDRGLFNPHTLDGNIVVDGFIVSTYTTAVPRRVASMLLEPLRILYKLGMVSDEGFREFLKHGFGSIVQRIETSEL